MKRSKIFSSKLWKFKEKEEAVNEFSLIGKSQILEMK
jgi:hypothetical protein